MSSTLVLPEIQVGTCRKSLEVPLEVVASSPSFLQTTFYKSSKLVFWWSLRICESHFGKWASRQPTIVWKVSCLAGLCFCKVPSFPLECCTKPLSGFWYNPFFHKIFLCNSRYSLPSSCFCISRTFLWRNASGCTQTNSPKMKRIRAKVDLYGVLWNPVTCWLGSKAFARKCFRTYHDFTFHNHICAFKFFHRTRKFGSRQNLKTCDIFRIMGRLNMKPNQVHKLWEDVTLAQSLLSFWSNIIFFSRIK